jgi:hypothetical protein
MLSRYMRGRTMDEIDNIEQRLIGGTIDLDLLSLFP